MGVPVLVQKNYTDPYLATEGWPDDEILRDFLIISFPFSEKLKTLSQKSFAFQLQIRVCLHYECSHKTILTPSQMTIPVSSLLRLGGS